jgi:tetratricopeptide (TPR) repeat protein
LTALFAYGQGQPQRAFEAAAAMAEFDHANSLEVTGLLAILPAPVALDSIRDALTRKLRAWRVGDSVPGQSVADWDLHAAMRLYYLGMLAVRREDWVAATDYADSLESLSSTQRARSHARGFAAGIRAHRAAAGGDRREALRLLGQVNDAGDQSSQSRFFGGLQSERYLRATLLEAAGRDDEALGVYESLVFGGIYETVLPGIASLHRGRILGRLGRRAAAIAEYRKFLDLWRSAERWGRPVIDSAVAELARIAGR